MKKLVLKTTSLFVILSLAFISCKKSVHIKTNTELLTQSSWKFSTATVSGVDVSNQDPPFSPCRKDNILTFSAGGNGNINEGATSCTPSENATFTWNFTTNETILHVSTILFPNTSNDLTIESLTETQLVVSFPYTPPVGPTLQVKVTFVH